MKRISLGTLCALLYALSTFGCPITFINDTESVIFAFDDGYNIGNIIEPEKQYTYGAKGRHPMVCLYMQAPGSGNFKKAFKVDQIACAIHEADKTVTITAIMQNAISKDIFSIRDFILNPEIPACCMHHEDNTMATDEPLSTMDEE